ncbi:MAG: site-specific integrase [Sphingobium sp.]|jgi:site-specific recombinase XerD|uniref:tyrosine-type recombinase/integrase n=1 Tax=Sphingobium sp. DEHP117 TaxID=2993436 RepID=UPI0027D4BA21|nr:tyrosine-type recombinase/integrase [Sphingobium sp. DEHP117]MCI1270649.1 site-specific integrase [Sphingobium sp.]MCI1754380.1 site-specific integrase [Sphingobium sp.]MCI2053391.1 site-specific integrase [Sphingobium sp.]MDQ4419250.1 tyrosine-type recombinase/integrase [Sphingobium sp. DEHP117]
MDANNRDRWFLDPGPLLPWIDKFAADLAAQRYTSLTIEGYTASARHFATWLGSAGIPIDAIDDNVVRRFAEHRCRCPGGRQWQSISSNYWRRAKRFCTFLQRAGVARAPLKVASPHPLLDDYQSWLRVHRGLSERTITRHRRDLHRLLPAFGTATHDYDATLVRKVVREWRERTGPANMRTITSALRSYLRFLAGAGLCRPNLDHAIPTVVQWRLSSLPRYLSAGDVDRVIASCDQLTTGRLRSRAILLLLWRLALRAGDVAGLRLSDLDWPSGMLHLRGKARREVRLPLPQDVGDAIIAYIEQERPRVDQAAVFVTMVAPYRSFSQSSHVSTTVALALKRAGISDPPSRGASLLRHSAATSMLRSGATLEAVGTMLRHRSLDMTAHYAKVDIPMLEQIAQPWPGELQC